ncbi:MAG: hypothetical protein AAF633_19310 [Chloroflexota bacterium]
MKESESASQNYHIYGRENYETPLTFVDEIQAVSDLKAEVFEKMGKDRWVELIALPADQIIPVTRKKQNATR